MARQDNSPRMIAIAKWWSPHWEVMSIPQLETSDLMLGNRIFLVCNYDYFSTATAVRDRLIASAEVVRDVAKLERIIK